MDPGMKEPLGFRQVGPHTLAPVEQGGVTPAPSGGGRGGVPPLLLRLHREDEIRDEYTVDQDLNSRQLHCNLRWTFQRIGP